MRLTKTMICVFVLVQLICLTDHVVAGNEDVEALKKMSDQCMELIEKGRNSEALQMAQKALAIYEKMLGKDEPDVAESLNNLALLYHTLGDYQKSRTLLKKALSIETALIEHVMSFTSEARTLKFFLAMKSSMLEYLDLINRCYKGNTDAEKEALNIWISRKGIILEAQKKLNEALFYSNNPKVRIVSQKLSRVRGQLSKLIFMDSDAIDEAQYQKKVKRLKKEKEKLQARLNRLTQESSLHKKAAKVSIEGVARALPQNSVLLDFVKINGYRSCYTDDESPTNRYLAFVLRPGSGDDVDLLDLGSAGHIDKEIASLKKALANEPDKDGEKRRKASCRLHDLVFEPLRVIIGDTKEIFVSPDGNRTAISRCVVFPLMQEAVDSAVFCKGVGHCE